MKKTFWLGSLHALAKGGEVDAVNLSVEGEVSYGFGIALIQWQDGAYAMQARVFSDAWKVFEDCPEVFKILSEVYRGSASPVHAGPEIFDELVARLKKAGWEYTGRQMARFYRRCDQCGSEVKASGTV